MKYAGGQPRTRYGAQVRRCQQADHFALPELLASVIELELSDTLESLKIMIQGKRLKDIADLPLDLAV